MAETSQYNFELKEVIEALINKQGLKEGVWALGIEFGFSAAAMGPTPEEAKPTALVQIMKLQLVKQSETNNLSYGIVDAAKIINKSQKTKPKSLKSTKHPKN